MSTKKNNYVAPKCESIDVTCMQLMAMSIDQVPVDPTPSIPASREKYSREIGIWDKGW